MARWLTDDEQATWRALVRATQVIDASLDRQLQRDAAMPHTYYVVLVALSEAPGRTMRMSDLAAAMNYSPSRVTHAVASMERSGWVQRRQCPNDRRSQLVSLTDDGFTALAGAAPGHVEEVRRLVFDRLTARQVSQLRDICTAIAQGDS